MGEVRAIFIAAAFFSFAIGAALLFAPGDFLGALEIDVAPDTILIARILGIPIGGYGVGYLFVAARPHGNGDLIRLGIIGKSALIVFLVIANASGAMAARVLAPAAVDLVFVALFLYSLRRVARARR